MPSSRPDSSVAPAPKTSIIPTIGGPYFALAVLFGMNLLNYIDRYSFFAVGTQIKRDLTIDDKWYGVLGGSFMIVYTIVSPLMGWLGDRYNRRMLLAGGVGLWSLATVGTAFSARLLPHVLLASASGSRRGELRGHSPGLAGGPFRGRETRPCHGHLLPGPANWHGAGVHHRRSGLLSLGLASRVPRGRHPGAASGPGRAAHSRSRQGCLRREEIHRQDRSTEIPRLCRTVQDADLRLQHGGDGRGHVRDGRLRRLGLDVLSAGSRDVSEGSQ